MLAPHTLVVYQNSVGLASYLKNLMQKLQGGGQSQISSPS
ncbi:hypothetical protein HMPREF1557_00728 [Streptococcus sobrinus W1703]|uniref:Uncharacterized protein n=1 Tax=Streptococcus sobrinus W1703 TaxID=1227275 RepID=U2KK65_9STRE|nr:hypothetical protein HMPREF1557_00728 [Streptococcus sobrinus W1703]